MPPTDTVAMMGIAGNELPSGPYINIHDHGSLLHEVASRLPTKEGAFRIHLFKDELGKEHLALVKGAVLMGENILTRVHSECLTGDLFGSLRCDCGPQLHNAMRMLNEEDRGILIYLRQEGRGIGLAEKLKAYNLQDMGYDTVDANIALGHEAEERDYSSARTILESLGVRSIRIITNNPDKANKLRRLGISITGMVPTDPDIGPDNLIYIKTKIQRMGHRLNESELHPYMPEMSDIMRYLARSREKKTGDPFIAAIHLSTLDGRTSADHISDIYRLVKDKIRSTMDAFVDENDKLHNEGSVIPLNGSATYRTIEEHLLSMGLSSVLLDGRSKAAMHAEDAGIVDVMINVVLPVMGVTGISQTPRRRTGLDDVRSVKMGSEIVFFGRPYVIAPEEGKSDAGS